MSLKALPSRQIRIRQANKAFSNRELDETKTKRYIADIDFTCTLLRDEFCSPSIAWMDDESLKQVGGLRMFVVVFMFNFRINHVERPRKYSWNFHFSLVVCFFSVCIGVVFHILKDVALAVSVWHIGHWCKAEMKCFFSFPCCEYHYQWLRLVHYILDKIYLCATRFL